MKKILLVMLSIILVITMFSCDNATVSSEETSSEIVPAPLNLKENRVMATSENVENKVAKAFDGNMSTYWANGPCRTYINDSITVDLGENKDLSKIVVNWGTCRAIDYKIELSRGGVEFESVFEGKDMTEPTDEITLENKVGRFLKITVTKCDGKESLKVGVMIKEVEVYGETSQDQTLGAETQKIIPTRLVTFTEENTAVTNKSYAFNYMRWDGSELDFKTTGGSIIGILVHCDDSMLDINYSIDGSEFEKLELTYGEKEYILAENLEDKPHEVRIVRGSSAGNKAYTLKAAIIEDIADLEVGYEREYSCKLQILGDSITAGGLNMFTDTYGFKLSEQLNAQTIYNAIPGGKLYYETKSHVSISDMFESTEFYTLKDYDFEYQPDVVVLSSGFNDHGPWKRNTDPTYRANFEKAMEEKYFEFFCFIHEKIPNAKILYSLSAGIAKIDVVDKVVSAAKKRAVEKYPELVIEMMYMQEKIDVNQKDPELWHPGEKTHERDSYVYAAKIKEMLNLK